MGIVVFDIRSWPVGFLDDFIKSVKKRNLGLTAKQKLLGQIIMSAVFCYIATEVMVIPTTVWVPFVNTTFDLGMMYYVLVFNHYCGDYEMRLT